MAALEAGIDVWADVDLAQLWAKSAQLFDILHAAGAAVGLECVAPIAPNARGSHISFRHPHAYALCQALIAKGLIGDFRDPDIIRFGLTPLYLSHQDVWRAGDLLREAVATEAWSDPAYQVRAAVT
jgi:kynureninase